MKELSEKVLHRAIKIRIILCQHYEGEPETAIAEMMGDLLCLCTQRGLDTKKLMGEAGERVMDELLGLPPVKPRRKGGNGDVQAT